MKIVVTCRGQVRRVVVHSEIDEQVSGPDLVLFYFAGIQSVCCLFPVQMRHHRVETGDRL